MRILFLSLVVFLGAATSASAQSICPLAVMISHIITGVVILVLVAMIVMAGKKKIKWRVVLIALAIFVSGFYIEDYYVVSNGRQTGSCDGRDSFTWPMNYLLSQPADGKDVF